MGRFILSQECVKIREEADIRLWMAPVGEIIQMKNVEHLKYHTVVLIIKELCTQRGP